MLLRVIVSSLASWGLILGIASGGAIAPMPHEQQTAETTQATRFRPIEQPWWLKGIVTAGGLALIGLELWWFLWSQPQFQAAEAKRGIQEITIIVDGGYEPSHIVVTSGQPVRLNFLRRDPSSCLEEVRLPDFHIARALLLDQVTPIEFQPNKPGTYPFSCGMNMFRGVIDVRSP